MAKEASSRIYTNTEIFEDIQTEIKELIARSVFKKWIINRIHNLFNPA